MPAFGISVYCILFLVPQSSMGPRVKDSEIGSIKKIEPAETSIALVCSAQAYPTPSFRYVNDYSYFFLD